MDQRQKKSVSKGHQEELNKKLKQKYSDCMETIEKLKQKYSKMLETNCKCERSKMDIKSISEGYQEKLKKKEELKQKYREEVETLRKLKDKYQNMLKANCSCNKAKRMKICKEITEGLNDDYQKKD